MTNPICEDLLRNSTVALGTDVGYRIRSGVGIDKRLAKIGSVVSIGISLIDNAA